MPSIDNGEAGFLLFHIKEHGSFIRNEVIIEG
jgi:hypothetical protein